MELNPELQHIRPLPIIQHLESSLIQLPMV